MSDSSTDSWLPYAGMGGIAVCCLGIELLGGAALLGGIAATVGLSTSVTYAVIVMLGGVLAALLAIGYLQVGAITDGLLD